MEGVEDTSVNEEEITPALRTTKLDLSENREMLKKLTQRISSLESRVVSTAGPASAPATVGPRGTSMSLDTIGGLGYGAGSKADRMYMPGPFTSPIATSGGVPGMVGGFDYISAAPISPASMPLHEVSRRVSVTSPQMQLPQVHMSPRPPASRKQSGVSFRMPSAPRDDPYSHRVPFSLVHPGEYVGRGTTPSTLHSARLSLCRSF
jgi:hypothetical protein